MTTYKIVRFYWDDQPNRVIRRGLSLEAARAHCSAPVSHGHGWFDGYIEEPTSANKTVRASRYWRLHNGLTIEQRTDDEWLVWDGPSRLLFSGGAGDCLTWLFQDPMTTRGDLSRAVPTDRVERR